MNYIFKTTATMKEYNNKKWYIDGGIVSDMRIDADSVENALEIYRERVEKKSIVSLFPKMPLKTSRKCSLIYQTGAQNKLVMLSRVKQNLTRAIMPDIAHNILICG